jgi:hypothetical protein
MDQLLMFAVAMQEGQYSLGAQVKVQSVKRALRHVAQRLVLDGHPNPHRASPAQQSLDLPIAHLIKKYHNKNPPAEPKLAIPISTITSIATNYRWNTHLVAAADLVIIAFFLSSASGGIHNIREEKAQAHHHSPGSRCVPLAKGTVNSPLCWLGPLVDSG